MTTRPAPRRRRRRPVSACVLAACLAAAGTFPAAARTADPDAIVMTFVGDVGLNSNHAPVEAKGVRRHGFQTWRETTEGIAAEIDGDLNFMNVETVVTDRNDLPRDTKEQSAPFSFRTHPEGLAHLLLTGFDVFSLANNHSMDYGLAGLEQTLAHVAALRGSGLKAAAGLGRNREEASRPEIMEIKGARIGFSAIGIVTNNLERHRAGEAKPGQIAYRFDDDFALVRKRLKDARADLRILSIHYGTEGEVRTDARQIADWRRKAAREDGFDFIVGHHAHVVRGVELAGSSLIMYGLGNFLHHGTSDITGKGVCRDWGLMVRVHLARSAEANAARPWVIGAVEAIPVTDTHVRPRRLEGEAGRKRVHALNHLARTLDSADGAEGLRFTPQASGTGLYCSAAGRAAKGSIGEMCAAWREPPAIPGAYAGEIAQSCAR